MKDEESKVIIKFIVMLVIVLVICVGIYFITKNVVNKDSEKSDNTNETTESTISYDSAIIGTMLNKKDSEYYVIVYDKKGNNATNYSIAASKYAAGKDTIPVYTLDLSNGLNSKYKSTEGTNPKASNLEDLRFGEITLLKISNGKITNAYESFDEINKIWKLS